MEHRYAAARIGVDGRAGDDVPVVRGHEHGHEVPAHARAAAVVFAEEDIQRHTVVLLLLGYVEGHVEMLERRRVRYAVSVRKVGNGAPEIEDIVLIDHLRRPFKIPVTGFVQSIRACRLLLFRGIG